MRRRYLHSLLASCLLLPAIFAGAAEIRGGVARVSIVPATPMFLSGYAGR